MSSEEFDLETNPIAWRLDYKAALLEDGAGPIALLEMSRTSIRLMQSQLPLFERMHKLAPGQYFVNIEQLKMLERDHEKVKRAPGGAYSLEDLLDHVVDAQELLVRMTKEMDRFNDDHAHLIEDSPTPARAGATGCAFALLTTTATAATVWIAATRL